MPATTAGDAAANKVLGAGGGWVNQVVTPVATKEQAEAGEAGDTFEGFRNGTLSAELFTLPNGINEFDLIYQDGE